MKRVTHYEGKYKRFVSVDRWEFVERLNCWGIVGVLAVTEDQRVILVEQMRIPVGKPVIEFPAGLADGAAGQGETLEDVAKRELLEETGYEAKKMKLCTQGPISSGSTSDILSLFRAQEIKKVGPGGGDATEAITVHEVPLLEIDSWLKQKEEEGILIDSKVYAGLYFLNQKNKKANH